MPVPKRRHSHSRSRKRKANWKIEPPALTTCSHCHQPKLPHRVCPNCGYYDDKEVMTPKSE